MLALPSVNQARGRVAAAYRWRVPMPELIRRKATLHAALALESFAGHLASAPMLPADVARDLRESVLAVLDAPGVAEPESDGA